MDNNSTIGYRLDIDLPESVATALTQRCTDTGESLGAIAAKALIHYLEGIQPNPVSLCIASAHELSLEQRLTQRIQEDMVQHASKEQCQELLLTSLRAIAIKDNMLRQLLRQSISSDSSFSFKPGQQP